MKSYEVIGYAYDAALHCVNCAQSRFESPYDSEWVDSEGNQAHPIFAGDESPPEGEYCDDCRHEISEPYPPPWEFDSGIVGSVSTGTLRTCDLIQRFLDTLSEVDSTAYAQLMVDNRGIPAYVQDEGEDSEWWESEEAEWLLEGLFEALDEACPEGYHFGAHEGDGADFGFWRNEEN